MRNNNLSCKVDSEIGKYRQLSRSMYNQYMKRIAPYIGKIKGNQILSEADKKEIMDIKNEIVEGYVNSRTSTQIYNEDELLYNLLFLRIRGINQINYLKQEHLKNKALKDYAGELSELEKNKQLKDGERKVIYKIIDWVHYFIDPTHFRGKEPKIPKKSENPLYKRLDQILNQYV